MRLYIFEFKKVLFHRYFIMIILGLLLLNIALCFRFSRTETVDARINRELYREISEKGLSLEEACDLINDRLSRMDIHSSFLAHNVYTNAKKQVEAALGYGTYLENIEASIKQLTAISIFNDEDSFTYRSMIKMPTHYRHLKSVKPVLTNSQPVLFATNRMFTDVFAVLLMLFIWSVLLLEEKAKGIHNFIRTTKYGRWKILPVKFLVCITLCTGIFLLLYGSNYFAGTAIYGRVNLSHPVQSLEGFTGCTLKVSIGVYLLIYAVTKICTYIMIAAVIMLLCTLARGVIFVFGSISIIAAWSVSCYTGIPKNSYIALFKYMNPAGLLRTNDLYKSYLDVNFLGKPVLVTTCAAVVIFLVILVPAVASFIVHNRQRLQAFDSGRLYMTAKKALSKIIRPRNTTRRLLSYEARKLMLMNKVIWILIINVIIALHGYITYRKPYIHNDEIYRSYLYEMEGEISSGTISNIEEQDRYFDGLRKQAEVYRVMLEEGSINPTVYEAFVSNINKELEKAEVLSVIKRRVYEIESITLPGGAKPWLVYDTGYRMLIGTDGDKELITDQLIFLASMTACFAAVYAKDNSLGMDKLLKSTKRGRSKTYAYRIIIGTLITLVLYTANNIPFLLNVLHNFGTRGMSAPIQSLEFYSSLPFSLSIGEFILLGYILKFIFVLALMCIMVSISIYSEDPSMAIIFSVGSFVLPLAILLLGAGFMINIGFNPFLLSHMLFTDLDKASQVVRFILNSLIIMAGGILLSVKAYRKACLPAK